MQPLTLWAATTIISTSGLMNPKTHEWSGLLQDFCWLFMDYGEHRSVNRMEPLLDTQRRKRPEFESMAQSAYY